MIYRTSCPLGTIFSAPRNVTFGYQAARQEFSVWHLANEPADCQYIVVGTGHPLPVSPISQLVGSVTVEDGFHTFHLVRL